MTMKNMWGGAQFLDWLDRETFVQQTKTASTFVDSIEKYQ